MLAVLAQQAGAEHWVVLNGYHQPIQTYYYIMTRNNQIASQDEQRRQLDNTHGRPLHCTADHILLPVLCR